MDGSVGGVKCVFTWVTYWKHNMLDSAADSFAFLGKPGLRSISSEVTDSDLDET